VLHAAAVTVAETALRRYSADAVVEARVVLAALGLDQRAEA
jgi:hypothetical protein